MASKSQLVLRGRERGTFKSEDTAVDIPKSTSEDFVEEYRGNIKKSKEEYSKFNKQLSGSARALRSKGLTRTQQLAVSKQKKKVAIGLKEIGEVEQKFEKQVAEIMPSKAKEKELSASYEKAMKGIISSIESSESKIESYKKSERQARDKGYDDRERKYDDKQKSEKAYLEVYKKALADLKGAKKTETIRNYYSGFIKEQANYKEDVAKARAEKSKAIREYKKELELAKIKYEELPSITSPSISQTKTASQSFIEKFSTKKPTDFKITSLLKPISQTKPIETERKGILTQGIDKIKEGTSWYEKSVVVPISKTKIMKPIRDSTEEIKRRLDIVGEDIIRPTVERTPIIKDVAKAKRQAIELEEAWIKQLGKVQEEGLTTEEFEKRLRGLKTLGGEVKKTKEGEEIIYSFKEPTTKIGLPGQIRDVPISKLSKGGLYDFSKEVLFGEVETAWTDIGRKSKIKDPELFGKVVRTTSEISPYLIPGVYFGEVGVRTGESAIGGQFGGPKTVYQFAKENPLDVAIVGAVGVGKGYSAIRDIGKPIKETSKFAREQARLYEKYKKVLKEPTKKKVVLQAETKLKQESFKQWGKESTKKIGKRKEFMKEGDGLFTKFGKKQKGITRVEYQKPTGRFKGTTEEQIKKLWGKPEVRKGKAVFTKKGEFIETMDFGKLKRVTKLKSSGKGSTAIFKKGKKVAEFPLKKTTYKDPLLESIKKSNKLKKQVGEVGTQKIKKISTKGLKDIKMKKKDLSTKTLGVEFKSKIKLGSQKGVRQRVEQWDDTLDIMRVSPKKKVEFIKHGKETAKKIKEVSAEVRYAKGKPKTIWDKTLYAKKGKGELLKKTISPTAKRKIIRKTGQKITLTYGDDTAKAISKPKVRGISKELLKKKQKELMKQIKGTGKGSGGRVQKLIQKTKKKQILEVAKPSEFLPKVKYSIPKVNIVQKLAKIKKISPISKVGLAGAMANVTKKIQKQNLTQSTKTVTRKAQAQSTAQAQDTAQAQKQTSVSKTRSISTQRPSTTTRSISKLISTTSPSVSRIIRPSIGKKDVGLEDLRPKTRKKKKKTMRLTKEKEFYMPEAKRNNKWVKLAKTGMTRNSALGRGARAVDNTVAGRFRIRPVEKGDPKLVDNYFGFNKKKFRDFKIKKGKKIPIKDKWIEKRGKGRIDTSGEKRGLTLAKFIKQKGWAGRSKRITKSKISI